MFRNFLKKLYAVEPTQKGKLLIEATIQAYDALNNEDPWHKLPKTGVGYEHTNRISDEIDRSLNINKDWEDNYLKDGNYDRRFTLDKDDELALMQYYQNLKKYGSLPDDEKMTTDIPELNIPSVASRKKQSQTDDMWSQLDADEAALKNKETSELRSALDDEVPEDYQAIVDGEYDEDLASPLDESTDRPLDDEFASLHFKKLHPVTPEYYIDDNKVPPELDPDLNPPTEDEEEYETDNDDNDDDEEYFDDNKVPPELDPDLNPPEDEEDPYWEDDETDDTPWEIPYSNEEETDWRSMDEIHLEDRDRTNDENDMWNEHKKADPYVADPSKKDIEITHDWNNHQD